MNRQLTALFAAFEAILVVAIGVAIPLVPLTLLWGIHFSLAIDWAAFWRASADAWLLGHGVDLTFTLDPLTAAQFGLPTAGVPFTVSIALLGFALLTAMLGIRAGRRVAETRYRVMGELVSLTTFALASLLVSSSAQEQSATSSLVQGTVFPTLVFAIGLAVGVRRTRNLLDDRGSSIRDWVNDWPASVRAVVMTALRGGAAAASAVIGLAAMVTAAAILFSYARIITLYEGLHTEVLGGVTLTLGQLALLPNLVIYTASWLIGPGFAVGTGSAVTPLATGLGPIPAIPVLGALPSGELAFGFLGLLVPVVAAFLVGAILGPGVRRDLGSRGRIVTGLGIGLVGGVILGLLAWASSGAAGPGRLQDVGPDPLAVGGWAALEIAVAALVGLFATLRVGAAKQEQSQR